MQQIYQHNVCFREGTAGMTEAVQEGRLILIAENSKFSAECYLVPGIASRSAVCAFGDFLKTYIQKDENISVKKKIKN